MLAPELIVAGTGCSPTRAATWQAPITSACTQYKITTPKAIAAFLAQIGVESAALSAVSENLNYSADGLLRTFPKYFDQATAQAYARQPQRIANRVYANRMGNGPEQSGDGWKYRGRGLIQITGHDNYASAGKALAIDLLNDPDQLTIPDNAALSAAWYFATNGCIALAEAGNFKGVCVRVNGGTNGLAERQSLYAAALRFLG